jgi:hypothetical protein
MTNGTLLAEMLGLWQRLMRMAGDSYRPERHYMRGAGPKTLARVRVR